MDGSQVVVRSVCYK